MQTVRFVVAMLALAASILPGLAQAGGATVVTIPISGPISSSPCEPETVIVDGSALMVIREEVDESGGFHQRFHFNLEGLRGVGESSGDRYSFQNTFNLEASVPQGEFREFTTTQNVAAHRQGSADNYRLHVVTHLTVNADGEVTVNFVKLQELCQG